MRRVVLLAIALAALGAVMPARATMTKTGSIRFATPSPTVPRAMWIASGESANGLTGYVFPVSGIDEHSYALTRTGGMTGLEDLDVWFYDGTSSPEAVCPRQAVGGAGGSETGVVCPGPQVASWAIVVIYAGVDVKPSVSAGGDASFTFSA